MQDCVYVVVRSLSILHRLLVANANGFGWVGGFASRRSGAKTGFVLDGAGLA